MLPTLAPNHNLLHLFSSLQKMLFSFITEGKLTLGLINDKFGEVFLGNDVVAIATVGQPGAARWDGGAAPHPRHGLPKPYLGNEGEVQVSMK